MLDALDSIALDILVELLIKPRTEAELVGVTPACSQPTLHRRVNQLRNVGLLSKQPGVRHAPGRTWAVDHPKEIDDLIGALLALSEAIDAKAKSKRSRDQRRLQRARSVRSRSADARNGND